jgi:hypothetical protein
MRCPSPFVFDRRTVRSLLVAVDAHALCEQCTFERVQAQCSSSHPPDASHHHQQRIDDHESSAPRRLFSSSAGPPTPPPTPLPTPLPTPHASPLGSAVLQASAAHSSESAAAGASRVDGMLGRDQILGVLLVSVVCVVLGHLLYVSGRPLRALIVYAVAVGAPTLWLANVQRAGLQPLVCGCRL